MKLLDLKAFTLSKEQSGDLPKAFFLHGKTA